MMNRLAVGKDGKIYWNGKEEAFGTLSKYLELTHDMNPEPRVFLEVEAGAPCEMLERVRTEMERKLDCGPYSACEEGVFSVWANLPTPAGTPPS